MPFITYMENIWTAACPTAFLLSLRKSRDIKRECSFSPNKKAIENGRASFCRSSKSLAESSPAIVDDMKHRHEVYNKQMEEIDRLEEAGDVFVIRPPHALDMKVTEKDVAKLQAAYDIGRKEAEKLLPALKEYLKA